jgi:hypothetical protein
MRGGVEKRSPYFEKEAVMMYKVGNNCHKNLSGVMANAHFGQLSILGTDGAMHNIPTQCIKQSGLLKKTWKSIFKRTMGYAIPA